jgi:hypothetical protein
VWSRLLPAPAVGGFVLLLAVLFVIAWTVGRAAGPVQPGMRPSGTTSHAHGGGMPSMPSMPGMDGM